MPSNEELLETYATIRRRLSVAATAVLKETGLGMRQFIILRTLAEKGEVNISELVELCMTDPGTVSRSIAQLKQARLVEKQQSKSDGRVWHVKLTKKGVELVPQLKRIYSNLSERCFGHLKAAEKEALSDLLAKIVAELEKS